jgi:hypothetical protein
VLSKNTSLDWVVADWAETDVTAVVAAIAIEQAAIEKLRINFCMSLNLQNLLLKLLNLNELFLLPLNYCKSPVDLISDLIDYITKLHKFAIAPQLIIRFLGLPSEMALNRLLLGSTSRANRCRKKLILK